MTTVDAPDTRRSFCARLKDERERRGTSLAAIAELTKVKASLLEALERGDLSRWPKGIYRRAFFREYVAAIGLPADYHVSAFIELFSDDDAPSPNVPTPNAVASGKTTGPLRLTFAEELRSAWAAGLSDGSFGSAGRRDLGFAAATDVAAVLMSALLVSTLAGTNLWSTAGVIACVYYSISTALLGRSGAAWLLSRHRLRAKADVRTAQEPLNGIASSSPVSTGARLGADPRVRAMIGHTFRGRVALRQSIDRLAGAMPARGNHRRQRELEGARQRRAEAANRSAVDEVSAIG